MAYTNREKAELKALSGKKHYAMGSVDRMIKKGASKDRALKKAMPKKDFHEEGKRGHASNHPTSCPLCQRM